MTHWCWDGDADASAYLSWERAARAATRLTECESIAAQARSRTYGGVDDTGAIGLWRSLFGGSSPRTADAEGRSGHRRPVTPAPYPPHVDIWSG